MKELNFLFRKKIIVNLKDKTIFCINVLCYESGLTYPIYLPNQEFKDCMDLLLISNEDKSHYLYIKDFNRFMCYKTKNKNKKYFWKCCLQCFSSEKVLIEQK